jgi:hypothetical protein
LKWIEDHKDDKDKLSLFVQAGIGNKTLGAYQLTIIDLFSDYLILTLTSGAGGCRVA